jgi:formate-dependent nitrite reductase cytochrome c552 subunit
MIVLRRTAILAVYSALLFVFSGCGDKTVVAPSSTKLEESQTCIDCHSSKQSPVTFKYISEEWKLSVHNTKNKAGCADCHEPAAGHPNNCNRCHGLLTATNTGYDIGVSRNPDKDGKCSKCHNRIAGFSLSVFNGVTTNTLVRHFNNVTSPSNTESSGLRRPGHPASYVSSQNVSKCRNCHNPHDTSTKMQKFREWSRSGKGNIFAPAWTKYDFKTYGDTTPGASPSTTYGNQCVRCHTATGFIKYVSGSGRPIAPWDVFGTVYPNVSPDKTKETLGCQACHDDGKGNTYSYTTRPVRQVVAYYNYSVNSTVSGVTYRIRQRIQKAYPDITTSNVCAECHVGLEIGELIRTAAPFINFSSIGFLNSHYLSAGATIFKTSGFHFYTSQAKYANPAFYLHDQIGVVNKNNTGSTGPCVTCHIGQAGEDKRHSFLPTDHSGKLLAKVCIKCHDPSSNPFSSAMNGTVIEDERSGFNATLAILAKTLKNKGYIFTDAYPYFGAGFSPELNWRKFTGGFGAGLVPAAGNIPAGALTMGAAFNLNLLVHDYGAFAHNRFYSKRLLYDAIDWMQDGVMGNGIEAGVNALTNDPSVFVSAKKGTVFSITPATRANAIAYLQGTAANSSGVGGTRP